MAERIKRLFEAGKLNAAGVQNACKRGLITEEECKSILMAGAALQPKEFDPEVGNGNDD